MLNDKYASPRSRAGSLATRNAEPRPSNAMRSSPLSQAMQLPSANYEKGKLGGIFTGMSGPKNAGTSDRTTASISIQSPNPAMNATQSTLTSIDIHKFSDDYFEVETYIRGVLQQLPSEDAIQQLHNSLTDAKDLAASDLQRNVFRNYNDFVIISKEISNILFFIIIIYASV
ncbi:hypothetical protein BASA50_000830 [Batrachochytrium salamandrivorans]|uniref:Vacuolar protein sorting-associated protein 51 homolog n=1 Tax=Batrachochytrium salamandrivorans TaxID=1357716 RepID=A0ABQ8ESL5_9FUNG|nr:hypothetical protein BASA50_000830 [Batrachochytrium salamandrivorans]KAH9265735.1 hypothetical protein BASA84_001474 [Batrachochytrium salamandrivorans]